jgi:hypothetical protein
MKIDPIDRNFDSFTDFVRKCTFVNNDFMKISSLLFAPERSAPRKEALLSPGSPAAVSRISGI